jgi:hypothetical protein
VRQARKEPAGAIRTLEPPVIWCLIWCQVLPGKPE